MRENPGKSVGAGRRFDEERYWEVGRCRSTAAKEGRTTQEERERLWRWRWHTEENMDDKEMK
jgi:hypothetical protein